MYNPEQLKLNVVPDLKYPFPNGGQTPQEDALKSGGNEIAKQVTINNLYGGKKSNNKLFKKTHKSIKSKSKKYKSKSRKHKSRKHKSRKHKPRKHKSRKHKSRKHKSRKHRNKINLKGGNIIVPTFSQSKLATSPYGDYTAQSAGFNSLYLQTLANSGGDKATLNGGGR